MDFNLLKKQFPINKSILISTVINQNQIKNTAENNCSNNKLI